LFLCKWNIFVMENDAFYILWYAIFSYLYTDLMEFDINTIQYNTIQNIVSSAPESRRMS
jgi:hypothetical protein